MVQSQFMIGWNKMTIKKIYKDDHDKFMENNIDINQYIQFDEKFVT